MSSFTLADLKSLMSGRTTVPVILQGETAERAWQEFLQVYRPLIDRAVYRTGILPQDHYDAVQEVLMQLLRVLPTFSYQKQRGFFRHWLRHVTTNKAIDFRRRRSGVPVPTDQVESISCTEDSESGVREFRAGLLKSAMISIESEFRPRTWQCFLLHGIEQLSAQETAGRVGVSINAVYVNTSRVMTRIREFCEFHGEDLLDESSPAAISH